jgi:pimeloyl-ACP methyl ester carboxylesterase
VSSSTSTAIVPRPSAPWSRLGRFLGTTSIPYDELHARYTTEASRFAEIDGTRVHYRIEGKGPPLLLVHGMLANLQTWDGWVERLAEHFTIYRTDVPGFGLTGPVASGDHSPEYSLYFFEQTRKFFGLERFHVAGNSLGGFFCWYYAAHHPERIDRMILIDPLSYPQRAPKIMRFTMSWPIRLFAPYCVPRWFIVDSLREIYGDESRIARGTARRYHELLLREGNRQSMIQFMSLSDLFFRTEADGQGKYARHIADVKAPTLVMWGEEDAWMPVAHTEAFRRDLPHCEIKRYPGVGHIPMEEIPEQTAADALDFLTR